MTRDAVDRGTCNTFYDRYIGPKRGGRRAMLTCVTTGRPRGVLFFPKDSGTDLEPDTPSVTKSWQDPPLLIYKDMNDKYSRGVFDGYYYAWGAAGQRRVGRATAATTAKIT